MNVILISAHTHPVALGLRYVSSYLKAAGHQVQIIFMGPSRGENATGLADEDFQAIVELCRPADLIGIGLMTSGFYQASALTEGLRQAGVKAPVVWGGTHPTVAPAESLTVADGVCIGEGEEPMRLLLEAMSEGRDPTQTPSFGFRAGGRFGNQAEIINPVLPLNIPLDDYPFPDYELETHWLVRKGKLVRARPELLRSALQRVRIQTTRGCPYRCTFCNNTVWQDLYRGKGEWVRKRSNDSILAEVKELRSRFPSVSAINIIDDLFIVRPEDVLEDFVRRYRAEINLPLEVDVFPNMITESKIAILSKLPLHLLSMGIQSADPGTLKEVYHRATPVERIAECIDLFHRYKLRAEYHYIIGNPYESEESLLTTMRFAASHHKGPAVLRVFPLMFYPGSSLHARAREDGLIGERHEDAYQPTFTWRRMLARYNYHSLWLDIVLRLRNVGTPSWLAHRIIDVVTHRAVRTCLDHKWFIPTAVVVREAIRKIHRRCSRIRIFPRRADASVMTNVPATETA